MKSNVTSTKSIVGTSILHLKAWVLGRKIWSYVSFTTMGKHDIFINHNYFQINTKFAI